MPAGGLQQVEMRARSASISLCDNCAAAPFEAPRLDWLLSVSAAAIWRCGSRLSSKAATWSALNLGESRGGVSGLALSSGFDGLAASFLRRSAIVSGL